MEFSFPRTFGQNEAKESLSKALVQGRFPHALLVHGEPGLGQLALLLDLAQILSCESPSPAQVRPCGKCFSCKAFQSASLESVHYLIPLVKKEKEKESEEGEETSLASAQIEELLGLIEFWHRAPYGFGVAEKAMVYASQVRELLGRLGYAGRGGRARVVMVPYLEALNPTSSNILLKTLEEPPENVYFLIASENRAELLPTLLSRCLHLGLSPLPPAEFRETVAAVSVKMGKPLVPALLPFAEGSPGVYFDFLEHGGEALLEDAAGFLSAATASDWRLFADHAASVEGVEETKYLIHFLLRCVRVHQSLKARHPASLGSGGREDGYRWTLQALQAEGWEPSLSAYLGPLEDVADLAAFATYLQTAFQAIKNYARPQIALLGLFLEYQAKSHHLVKAPAK